MKKIIIFLVVLFFLPSCKSAKDALTLKKKTSADEFLVEKKSPLVLPPDYGKLPIPQGSQTNDDKKDEEIKILVKKDGENSSSKSSKNSNPTSIEKSILEKIK
tara:strand:+ start:2826 stop:3134 length:309 start_codon:yes stop_codon:yes gene_type:complete